MTFDAEASEGAGYRVNRKNLGAGGSDTLFTITVTAEDGETKNIYQVTVHRGEKETSVSADSTPKPATGSQNSKNTSVSQTDQPDNSQSSGLEETSASGIDEEIIPVAGLTDTGSGPGSGSGENGGEGTEITEGNPGGVVFQHGDASLVPGMLAMLLFVLFCFLSGPLAKGLAK